MSLLLTERGFDALNELIAERIGLVLSKESLPLLQRRIQPVMRKLQFTSFSDFILHLRLGSQSENAWSEVIEAVTIHETYFFRNPEQLQTTIEEALPLATQGDRARAIVWSAACSTGEEVYSLAILLQRSAVFAETRVYGSDISRTSIRAARRGLYGANSFRETLPHVLEPYVRRTMARPSLASSALQGETQLWEVDAETRALCSFSAANLLEPSEIPFRGVHVAVCRNVFIYMDSRARKLALDVIFERLVPGGILVLGHAESLLPGSTQFELHSLSRDLVYRKPLNSEV
jgi:chemotaxis protein methyltransferase CheR